MAWWNFRSNIEEYNKAKKNPIVVKMWTKVPLREVKDKYFVKHIGLNFIQRSAELPVEDFIVSIEGEGYWISGIITANSNKRYEQIRKGLFDDGELKSKTTYINGKAFSVVKLNKRKKEIEGIIKLPS